MTMRERYLDAMHAMQTGVKMLLTRQAPEYEQSGWIRESQECSPKHLRVGVNSALIDSGAVCKLLIEKGVFTLDEFTERLVELAEGDVASYREKLDLPPNVTLR